MASMSMKDRVLTELQMLTGVVTNDIDYLVYLVLKDGSYLSEKIGDKFVKNDIPQFKYGVEEFNDWFSKQKEAE